MAGLARRVWFAVKERLFLQRHRSQADRFGAIYRERLWQNPETASGFGSTLAATRELRSGLATLISEKDIASWLDAPCGDFNWQSALDFNGHYVGADIVPEMIAANRQRHGNDRREFIVADIVRDELPAAQMVLCRECLNHLPLEDGVKALANLERSATRFVLVTHYPYLSGNRQQAASLRYRPLNLTLPPFGLREPDATIDEGAFEPGKQVAIWDLANGPLRRG